MAEKLRYCIEYINPRFPLLDNGNLNIRHLRVEKEHFAEICITLILSFGGKILSTYKGAVTRGRVVDWNPTLELEDKFSNKWLSEVLHEYPYFPGWRRNGEDNKPEVKHSVLMLTTHGIAEGEWLGDGIWCQYRWSCKVKDSEVLYWMHLEDLMRLEKEGETLRQEQDMREVSDGYHTFNELYYYRMLYNAAFFNLLPKGWVHKSKRHHTSEECFGGGWFVVMANLPTGQISNHYELKDWDLFNVPEKEFADERDGHTPQEAAKRIHKYLTMEQPEVDLEKEQDEDLENYISNKLRKLGEDLINHKPYSFNRGLNVGKTNAYNDILDRLNARKK